MLGTKFNPSLSKRCGCSSLSTIQRLSKSQSGRPRLSPASHRQKIGDYAY